ncbi:MAG: gluconokinase [Desulfobacterales bacterium]
MNLVLAIDIGTGSCRSAVYNQQLQCLSNEIVEYTTRYPQPDWAEQEPEVIFRSVLRAIEVAVSKCHQDPDKIIALTLDCSIHTLLGLAKDFSPITPNITWEDSRARHLVESWKRQGLGADIYQLTGCPLHPMYASAKIAWWRKHQSDLFRRIITYVSVKAFVVHRLTGALLEDLATVSGSGLLNIHKLDWEDSVLSLAGISRNQLPPVVDPTVSIESILPEISRQTGLPVSTRVIIGSSDAAMSSLGCGTVESGQMTVMIGTSGAVRRLVRHPTLDPQQRTFCYYMGNQLWFAGGAINNGGIALRWFRDNFGERARVEAQKTGASVYKILCDYAQKVPAGSDGLLFLPFLAGERSPHWNSSIRGTLFGLSLHHSQSHIIRSLLEGICYRLHSVIQPLEELIGKSAEIRVTGGFTRSPLWLQILSDVLGRELMVAAEPEGSVLGAAAFAYHTLGMIDSFKYLLEKNPITQKVRPKANAHEFYRYQFDKYMHLYWKFEKEFA